MLLYNTYPGGVVWRSRVSSCACYGLVFTFGSSFLSGVNAVAVPVIALRAITSFWVIIAHICNSLIPAKMLV